MPTSRDGRIPDEAGSNDSITYPDFITDATIPVGEPVTFASTQTVPGSAGLFNPFESPSDSGFPSWHAVISPSTNPGPSPQNTTAGSSTSALSNYRLAELTRLNGIPITRDMPMEDVGPWAAMSEILSVYLRYLHSLFPLVHKPSFAQALAMRKDQVDRAFAALLLGLGMSTRRIEIYADGSRIYYRPEPAETVSELHAARAALVAAPLSRCQYGHAGQTVQTRID